MTASLHSICHPSRRSWLRQSGIAATALILSPRAAFPLLWNNPRPNNTAQISLTDAQEIALGRRFAAVFETETPILNTPLIDQHLNQVARELAARSRRPTLPYRVKVINLPAVNAVSLPGGTIYIHRGLLEILTTEDELAAVLAHEIGHIVARHALHQLALTLQAQALLKPLIEDLARQNQAFEGILQHFGGAVALMARLAFSQPDELEADRLGFYETLRAGWDPRGFLKLFSALKTAETTTSPAGPALLSTHPPTPERAAAIEHELASVTIPEDARTDSLEFRACKQALALLGAHPLSPSG